MKQLVRIATRKSELAMWQAKHVRDLLLKLHDDLHIELVPIVTRGDIILDIPLAEIGGKGLFLKELEKSLLDGETDLAVHSMKDMPAENTPGLSLEVSLPRGNPFDAWVCPSGFSLQDLPPGSGVGTSSLRRQSQLSALRPDLRTLPLRGNVITRMQKLNDGEFEAIILACAGLERLGLEQHICQPLQPPQWLPAATQGIIGLQCRTDDIETSTLIKPLADPQATVQSIAERTVSRILQGSCQVPLGAYASLDNDLVRIQAMVGTPDGTQIIRAEETGPSQEAGKVGEQVALMLLEQGAQDIISALSDTS